MDGNMARWHTSSADSFVNFWCGCDGVHPVAGDELSLGIKFPQLHEPKQRERAPNWKLLIQRIKFQERIVGKLVAAYAPKFSCNEDADADLRKQDSYSVWRQGYSVA